IKEIADECECSVSKAHFALSVLIAIKAISAVTPAEARKIGLPSRGSRTLRYRVLWQNFPSITTDLVDEVRDKLEPQEEDEPEAEIEDDPEPPALTLVSPAPGAWKPLAAGKSRTIKLPAPTSEVPVDNDGACAMDVALVEGRIKVRFVDDKTVTDTHIPAHGNIAKSGNNTSRKPNGRAAPPEAHEPAVELPAVAGLIEGCKKAGLVIDEEIARRALPEVAEMPLPYLLKKLKDRVSRGINKKTTPFTAGMLPKFVADELGKWIPSPEAVEEDARAQRVRRAEMVDRIAEWLMRSKSPSEPDRAEIVSLLVHYHEAEPEAYAEAVKKAGM
ncbi:MAG: hypothetical protein KGL39_51660, partial [Patescibacteria group bacterium]|nr:hypothetical protein [Patescibacteria group bacterium]